MYVLINYFVEFTTVDVAPRRHGEHLQTENIRIARENVNRILQNSSVTKNSGSPVSLSKHKRTEPIINDFFYDTPVKTLQVKNPMAIAQNIEIEERDETEIRNTDVEFLKHENNFPYENLRFQNRNNNEKQSGMYSNQAASIFYGNTGNDSSSLYPPTPKPRKFLEDFDDNPVNDQTSA